MRLQGCLLVIRVAFFDPPRCPYFNSEIAIKHFSSTAPTMSREILMSAEQNFAE